MRVIVRRVEAGIAAASSLLVSAGVGAATIGCADESSPEAEEYGLSSWAQNPGAAELQLQLGNPGMLNVQPQASTTDEFVRVGESLKVVMPAWLLWETLYPNDAVPDDARLKKLSASVKVSFLDKTKTLSTKTVSTATWRGSSFSLEALTAQLKVPAKTDTIKMTLTIKDAQNPAQSKNLGQSQIGQVAVFGGDLPDKTLLFDNDNGTLRQRIVDGDPLVKGSKVTLDFTDWRADQIVDKTSLNLQIGTATFNGRFGPAVSPIYGTLTYEVSYGSSFDGVTFNAEKALSPSTTSRVVGAGRTAYEALVVVPTNATKLLMYVHVKAVLVADYTKYQSVNQKWYGDNEKVVLKDAYDNPSGAFTNYDIPVQ